MGMITDRQPVGVWESVVCLGECCVFGRVLCVCWRYIGLLELCV